MDYSNEDKFFLNKPEKYDNGQTLINAVKFMAVSLRPIVISPEINESIFVFYKNK